MGRRRERHPDEEYLLSAWEWAAEEGIADKGGVHIAMTPTPRKGIWKVAVRVVHVVDGRATGVVCQVWENFPNSTATSLTALMLKLTTRLELALEEDPLKRVPPT